MYKVSYAEILEGSSSLNREREREALEHAVGLLTQGKAAGLQSNEMRAALTGLQDLWCFFIADLANQDNALPQAVRANLASIGLWIIEQADHILNGRSENVAALIDVNRTIRDGLQ